MYGVIGRRRRAHESRAEEHRRGGCNSNASSVFCAHQNVLIEMDFRSSGTQPLQPVSVVDRAVAEIVTARPTRNACFT